MTDPQRCEPPNLVVEGCTVHNTVTLDLALVRALVEALDECANDLEAHVMREYSGDVLTVGNTLRRARDLDPVDAARAALARAKEAGL